MYARSFAEDVREAYKADTADAEVHSQVLCCRSLLECRHIILCPYQHYYHSKLTLDTAAITGWCTEGLPQTGGGVDDDEKQMDEEEESEDNAGS